MASSRTWIRVDYAVEGPARRRKPRKFDWLIPLAVGIAMVLVAYAVAIFVALALFAPTGD
jgi:hypothetical protein